MAIVVPQKRQKEGALDKIAKGLNIAESLLGIGLSIPKYIQDRKASKQSIAASKANVYESYEPSEKGAEGAVDVGGDIGYVTPRPKTSSTDQEDYFRQKFLDRAKEGQFLGWNNETKEVTPFFLPEQDFNNPQLNSEGLKPIRNYEDYVNIKGIAQRSATGALQRKQTEKAFGQQVSEASKNRLDKLNEIVSKHEQSFSDKQLLSKDVEDNLSARTRTGDMNAQKAFARAYDKGALSDRDTQWAVNMGAPGKLQDIKNWIFGSTDAVLTEEIRNSLRFLNARKYARDEYDKISGIVRDIQKQRGLYNDNKFGKAYEDTIRDQIGADDYDAIKYMITHPDDKETKEAVIGGFAKNLLGE